MVEKEYIERGAVIKEIEEGQKQLETNNDVMWEINKKYYKGLALAHRIVGDQPAADVVEVVRCKDCALRYTTDCASWHSDESDMYFHLCDDDDFCSSGVRKE
jgi:hypothetical protein